MKALNIQQPWASLICTGIKDIENRSWKPQENPERILIVASSKKVPKNFLDILDSEEQFMEIATAQDFGQIPSDLTSLPTSAIVGYADIEGFYTEADSCWGYTMKGNINWKIKNGHLFKKPIPYPKGRLHIYDIPEINEEGLPETVTIPRLKLDGETLRVPMSEENIEFYKGQKHPVIPLFITDSIENLLLKDAPDGSQMPVTVNEVSLEGTNGDIISYKVKEAYFINSLDNNGNVIEYIDWHGNKVQEQLLFFDSITHEERAKEEQQHS